MPTTLICLERIKFLTEAHMHYFANSGSVFNWLSPAQCPVPVGPGLWASLKVGRQCVTKGALFSIVIAITGVLCMASTQPAFAQEKRGVIPDRKSTPSELQSLMRISYAVFCLKK